VVQDVFFALWRNRHQLQLRGTLRVYLYRATRNRALNRLRDERTRDLARHDDPAEVVSSLVEPPLDVAESLELDDLRSAALRAVDRLPPRCRAAYQLRQQELSYAEIATVMEVSIQTVKNQIGRAFRALRDELQPWV
jgi:RNA polymerase sigma-70 factor (ECF subfamily)